MPYSDEQRMMDARKKFGLNHVLRTFEQSAPKPKKDEDFSQHYDALQKHARENIGDTAATDGEVEYLWRLAKHHFTKAGRYSEIPPNPDVDTQDEDPEARVPGGRIATGEMGTRLNGD